MDDVRPGERLPIHVRFKQQRGSARRNHFPRKLFVYFNAQGPGTVLALGMDADPQLLSPEASFDEGRGERILGSSPIDAVAGRKRKAMGSLVRSHRERPIHVAVRVADQKKKISFEFPKNR